MTNESSQPGAINRKAVWWSVVGTVLLLPVASALFLFFFDRGTSISFESALTFPGMIYWHQGVLVGTIVNAGMIAFTFIPLFVLLRSKVFRNNITEPLGRAAKNQPAPRSHSIPARVLAAIDLILGTVLPITVLDYPLISLAIMVPMYAVAYGLFTTKRWGWYLALCVHLVIVVGGLVAYAILAVLEIQDFGRPRGHMEPISSKAALVMVTIAFFIYEAVAAMPIVLLLHSAVRSKFLSDQRI